MQNFDFLAQILPFIAHNFGSRLKFWLLSNFDLILKKCYFLNFTFYLILLSLSLKIFNPSCESLESFYTQYQIDFLKFGFFNSNLDFCLKTLSSLLKISTF